MMQTAIIQITTTEGQMEHLVLLDGARRIAKKATELSITEHILVTTDDNIYAWTRAKGWEDYQTAQHDQNPDGNI